jgi:hypothetical protein
VAAAFSVNELRSLAQRAGWHHARASHHWPFRVRLVGYPAGVPLGC